MITLDLNRIYGTVPKTALENIAPRLKETHMALQSGTARGAEYTGWKDWPQRYDKEEVQRIKSAARRIQSDSQVLVVIGIGGSYLGAKAAIDLLCSPNYNLVQKQTPDIFFAGNSLSSCAIQELMAYLEGKDFSINVISKSGTTTEPAVAFRLLRALLEQRYKEKAGQRIYVTTDQQKGALRALATEEQWTSFVIPDDIGGRYSVLTAVGLLPMAVAGIEIDAVLLGAAEAMQRYSQKDMENPAWQYAAARHLLYQSGKQIELLAFFEPSFRFLGEWWKQLFGESEGKEGCGLFPASVEYTADLHSMGQYVQDGKRLMFETMLAVQQEQKPVFIPKRTEDGDGLNFLAGQTLQYVSEQARMGTALAHLDGGVPNLTISLKRIDETNFGWLVYFFELSCALSGYLLGVNPFDQPGVEAYKKNMFALLGKPGYEELQIKLKDRLGM